MDNYFNDPQYQQAKGESQNAVQAYGQAAYNEATLPDMLYDTLNKKFSTDNPLYAQRENALKNYMTVSETAPQNVLPENNNGMVFNPLEQAGMIAGERANAFAPITSLNELIGYQFGGIENVVDRATKMYAARAAAAKNAADLKRQAYEDLRDEIITRAEYDLELKKIDADKSGGLGGDMAALIELLLGKEAEDDSEGDQYVEDDTPTVGLTPGLQFLNTGSIDSKKQKAISDALAKSKAEEEKRRQLEDIKRRMNSGSTVNDLLLLR